MKALLLLLLLASPAFCRIGESLAETEVRLGISEPDNVRKNLPAGTEVRIYRKDGFEVAVHFFKGKSAREEYRKDEGGPFAVEEAIKLLFRFAGDWKYLGLNKDNVSEWDSRGSLLWAAYFSSKRPMLMISTDSYTAASAAAHKAHSGF